MTIQVDENDLAFITDTLKHKIPKAKFWAFGSRIKGNSKPYSDFDIAIVSDKPISLITLSEIDEIFSNSDLPFKIDLIDWHRISPEFQQLILKQYVAL